MSAFAAGAAIVVVAVAAEIVLPGRDVYHTGWFNVVLVVLTVIVVTLARAQLGRRHDNRARAGVVAVAFGAAVVGVAGVANGLFAPDNLTTVGAPGQRIRVDELGGSLLFPFADFESANALGDVVLERPNHPPLSIGDRGRNAGTFLLRTAQRTVVYIDARDLRGGRLTITQPTGSSFLSPVLMMQQRQSIAGLNVPFDSFAVPAARRLVKAILFTADQADMMRGLVGGIGPAVLFAVDDESDRPLPHSVGAVRSGAAIEIGGMRLRAVVFSYPAVEAAAVPSLSAVIAGALLVIGGLIAKGPNGHADGP